MNGLICVLLFVLVVEGSEEHYSTKFDNIDYDEIIRSDRLLKNYVNCVLDRGGCTPEGKELRRILPDAINTECSKCSEIQKEGARKIINYLANNKQEWWNELLAKYDPDGVYKKKYEHEWLETNSS